MKNKENGQSAAEQIYKIFEGSSTRQKCRRVK